MTTTYTERANATGRTVRTATTNAGSLRTGDVLAEGFAGLSVSVEWNDGTNVAVRTYSLQTGRTETRHLPVTTAVTIVHPDDTGRELPRPATDHAPTFGPPNPWTWKADTVHCSCGWSWKRGTHDVCGTRGVWEQHVRRSKAAQ